MRSSWSWRRRRFPPLACARLGASVPRRGALSRSAPRVRPHRGTPSLHVLHVIAPGRSPRRHLKRAAPRQRVASRMKASTASECRIRESGPNASCSAHSNGRSQEQPCSFPGHAHGPSQATPTTHTGNGTHEFANDRARMAPCHGTAPPGSRETVPRRPRSKDLFASKTRLPQLRGVVRNAIPRCGMCSRTHVRMTRGSAHRQTTCSPSRDARRRAAGATGRGTVALWTPARAFALVSSLRHC